VSSLSAKNYRADLDGLRGIAILGVLFYHAEIPGFSSGFLGVDYFFVLSGYLISHNIAQDLERQQFSWIDFYCRRCQRLVPPLLLLFFGIFLSSFFFYTPELIAQFGRSLTSSSLFFSNIQFYLETGYFDLTAETKPLLHTWSLSVEEQFYALWPLFLYFLFNKAPKTISTSNKHAWRLRALSVVILSSYLWMTLFFYFDPDIAFYFLPARIWQFGIGTFVALQSLATPPPSPSSHFPPSSSNSYEKWANPFALIGCLISFSLFKPEHPTSLIALSGLSIAYLIHQGKTRSTISPILEFAPLSFIGKISYSLYLWHWPVVLWIKDECPDWGLSPKVLAIFLSCTLGFLSWRLIEKPCRKQLLTRPKKIATIVVSISLLLTTGLLGKYFPFGKIWGEQSEQLLIEKQEKIPLREDCHDQIIPALKSECQFGTLTFSSHSKNAKGNSTDLALLTGDSHAIHQVPFVDKLLKNLGMGGVASSVGHCAIAPGTILHESFNSTPHNEYSKCLQLRDIVQDHIKKSAISEKAKKPSKLIIIAQRWEVYFKQSTLNGITFQIETSSPSPGDPVKNSWKKFIDQLVQQNFKILILGQTPMANKEELKIKCIVKQRLNKPEQKDADNCGTEVEAVAKQLRPSKDFFKGMHQQYPKNLFLFFPDEVLLVRDGKYSATLEGHLILMDRDHVTKIASEKLYDYFPIKEFKDFLNL
jgi:peptidoglycan/LPS O-acetylase OafA/YrhL